MLAKTRVMHHSPIIAYLQPKGQRLYLDLHASELLDILPCANQILRLNFGSAHVSIFRTPPDVLLQLLLLVGELRLLPLKLADGLLERVLVLAEFLSRRHALAEGPFYNLEDDLETKQLVGRAHTYIHVCSCVMVGGQSL